MSAPGRLVVAASAGDEPASRMIFRCSYHEEQYSLVLISSTNVLLMSFSPPLSAQAEIISLHFAIVRQAFFRAIFYFTSYIFIFHCALYAVDDYRHLIYISFIALYYLMRFPLIINGCHGSYHNSGHGHHASSPRPPFHISRPDSSLASSFCRPRYFRLAGLATKAFRYQFRRLSQARRHFGHYYDASRHHAFRRVDDAFATAT